MDSFNSLETLLFYRHVTTGGFKNTEIESRKKVARYFKVCLVRWKEAIVESGEDSPKATTNLSTHFGKYIKCCKNK